MMIKWKSPIGHRLGLGFPTAKGKSKDFPLGNQYKNIPPPQSYHNNDTKPTQTSKTTINRLRNLFWLKIWNVSVKLRGKSSIFETFSRCKLQVMFLPLTIFFLLRLATLAGDFLFEKSNLRLCTCSAENRDRNSSGSSANIFFYPNYFFTMAGPKKRRNLQDKSGNDSDNDQTMETQVSNVFPTIFHVWKVIFDFPPAVRPGGLRGAESGAERFPRY